MFTKLNSNISIIRVFAMLSIIVGHYLSMQGINHFQFGAIGVEIFFFISGYLYANKDIGNIKKWFYNRWKRLIIPYWIVLGGCILLRISFSYEVTHNAITIFFLNLQGVDRVFRNLSIPILKGMGQTWFLTVLILCYLIMVFLKKNQKIENIINENKKTAFIWSVFVQILLSFIGIQIIRPLCFFYGYFWRKSNIALNIPLRKYTFLTIILLLGTLMRFVVHIFYDGSVLYDYIVFGWSFIILAVWLIVSIVKILDFNSNMVNQIVNSKIWKITDLMTYPLFLTHYIFASGEFAVVNWVNGLFGQVMVFVILTYITGFLLLCITDYKKMKKIISN